MGNTGKEESLILETPNTSDNISLAPLTASVDQSSNSQDSNNSFLQISDLWSFILNGISEMFIFYNPDLTVNWANKAVSDILKKNFSDFSNISCREIWHKESKDCLECPLHKAKETLLPQEGEITLNNKSIWFIRAYPLFNENKNLIGFTEFAIDITKKKIAEQTAMQSEQKMGLALQAAQSGAWDRNLITGEAWWSPEMYELWGVTPGTFMNTEAALEIVDLRDYDYVKNNITDCIAEHKNLNYEFRIRHSTKGERWMATSGKVIYDETGKAVRIIGISSDITEAKSAREALKQTEKKYRTLHETMRDAFVSVDLSGRITEFNNAFLDLVGYPKEEVCNLTYQQLTPEKWHSYEEEIVKKQILTKGYSPIYEKEYRKKDGTIIPVELRTFLISNDNGEPERMWAIIRDITERKKAESALKASEECLKLKLNFLLSPDIDISDLELSNILDIPAIQTLMNDFYSLSGMGIALIDLKGEILVATGWQDICTQFHRINPETRKNCRESDLLLTKNICPGKFQIYKCKNNMWDVATPLFIGGKHVANIFFGQFFYEDEVPDKDYFIAQAERYGFNKKEYLSALDQVPRFSRKKVNNLMEFYSKFASLISKLSYSNLKLAKTLSEQKRVEEELIKEQEKAEQYLDIAPSIILSLDRKGNIDLLNKYGSFILECDQDWALGKNWFDTFLPEEIRDSVKEVFNSLINEDCRTYQHYENTFITAKGNRKIIRWHNSILKSESDEITGILTSGEDITELKKYEEGLHVSEQRYRLLFEAGNDAVYVHTIKPDGQLGCFTEVNEVACTRLGYSREEMLKMTPANIDADEFATNKKIAVHKLLHDKQVTFEMVHRAKDGKRIPVEINSATIEIDGTIYVISIARDITERIQAMKALKENEVKLKEAQALGRIGSWEYDIDKGEITWSDETYILFERDISLGPPTPEEESLYYSKEQTLRIREFAQRAIEEGKEFAYELEPKLPSGKKLHFSATMRPIKNSFNKIIKLFGTIQDITERKESEEALRDSESNLRKILQTMNVANVIVNAATHKIVDLNQKAIEMIGLPREQILGRVCHNFICQNEIGKCPITDLGKDVDNRESMLIRADGSQIDIIKSVTKVNISDKACLIESMTDISERKRYQRELEESEAKYRSLIENINDLVYSVDTNGILTYLSPAVKPILGYTEDEGVGKHFSTFIHPDDLNKVQIIFKNALEGHTEPAEFRLIDKNGNPHYVYLTAQQILDGDRISGFSGIISDITERKLMEEKLVESEAKHKSFIHSSSDMIMLKDDQFRYTIVNKNLLGFFGKSEEDVVGKTDYELMPKYAADNCRKSDLQAIESGITIHTEETIGNKTYETVKFPVKLKGDKIGVGAIIKDITERKEIEKERLEMQKQFLHTQKLESLGVLAGGIAHDFNNLLMAILGNLDIAIHNPLLPELSKSSIQQAVNAAYHATDLTHQMLAYAGRSTIVNREINLSFFVEENAQLLKVSIHKTITLNINLDKNIPHISADPGQLQQIVMNLITNASDAIGENAGAITITTGAMNCDTKYLRQSRIEEKPPEGKFVYLEVADTGCGMDENTLQEMFDPFFTTKFTGRGLGMSALLGIVRSHKGAILVESKAGEGTSIKLLFPVLDRNSLDENGDNIQKQNIDNNLPVINGTILVVDDEDAVRDVCKSMVELLGCKVITANNGFEAVEIFRNNRDKIDCVILDLSMPVMDGITAFNELKKIKSDIKVLLSSGFSENDATQHFINHGVTGFIQKPYNLQDLQKALTGIMTIL